MVPGNNGYRVGQGRATKQRAPPYEGIVPHPQEQSTPADWKLYQAVQGICRGVPQQRSRKCK